MNIQSSREAGILEKSFVVVALLFFAEPFLQVLPPEDHNYIYLVESYSIYIITIFIIRNKIKDVLILVKREKFLICLLVITIFSIIWSDFPFFTARRSVGFVGSTLFGIYLAERYTLKEQLHMLGIMLGISAILSLLFVLLLPLYGVSSDAHEGAWQGIFVQKNILGHNMVIGSLVFFLLCIDEKEFRWIKLVLLALTLVLLVRSQSVTSVSLTLVSFSLLLLYKSLQWNFLLRGAVFCLYTILIIITVFWISENHNFILNAAGRDFTMTGRTEIWESIIPMAEKRLILGYGFNAFWVEGSGKEYVQNRIGFDPSHSHNAILDIWLNVGLLGVIAFGLSFLQAFGNSIKYIRQKNNWSALWPLCYLASLLAYSFFEGGFFRQCNIYWVLYVSVAIFYYRQDSIKEYA